MLLNTPSLQTLRFKFSKSDIIDLIGNTYYQRALTYHSQGAVEKISIDEDDDTLTAIVKGRFNNRYNVTVNWYEQNYDDFEDDEWYEDDWVWEAECSCPIGFDCKHVGAALLTYLEKTTNKSIAESKALPQKPKKQTLDQWIAHTQISLFTQPSSQSTLTAQHSLLYIIKHDNKYDANDYTVELIKSRNLKDGGWSSHYHAVNYQDIPHWGTGNWYNKQDVSIINFLKNESGSLTNSTGSHVLALMIASGRCFLNDTGNEALSSPLTQGPTKTLDLHWHTDKQHKQLQITLNNDSNDWQLIPCTPPWYLFTDSNQAGPINTPFDASLLQQLISMPKVTKSQAEKLATFLYKSFPNQSIPLPAKTKIEKITTPPVPCITLRTLKEDKQRINVMSLSYQYGPLQLYPVNPSSDAPQRHARFHIMKRKEYEITRAPDVEHQYQEQFFELGLLPPLWSNEQWVYKLDASPSHDELSHWSQLLDTVLPNLEKQGWQITKDKNFSLDIHEAPITYNIGDQFNGWFNLSLDVEIEGRHYALIPLLHQVLLRSDALEAETIHVPISSNQYVAVSTEAIRPIVNTLLELYNKDGDSLSIPNHRATFIHQLPPKNLDWSRAQNIKKLAKRLANFKGIKSIKPARTLKAELRDYQSDGLSWLYFLQSLDFGGILADDMGLGKTIQSLAYLQKCKTQKKLNHPALVIAPTSLVNNWQTEAARFTPNLNVLILHGSDRQARFGVIEQYDLVITTYPLIVRDFDELSEHEYSIILLDEAQYIKNPKSKASVCVKQLRSTQRLCLTGTPLENHLGEIWSIMDFAMPGLLGNEHFFKQCFRNPIEKQGSDQHQQELNQRIAPFLLRRTKEEVASDLPEKTEIIQTLSLSKGQHNLYETIRSTMEKKVRSLLKSKGMAKSHIEFLDALLKLRQACCDPRLVKLEQAKKVKQSAKLEWLRETLPEMIAEGRKVLIFSQFTSMLALIESELSAFNICYEILTGKTKKRAEAINAFQHGDTPVFLISLKAGGVGLNLTAADTVIHFDPWWNPAVENQATDRAHRIGQDKPVFVYKLITENTVEEKIQVMQQQKQAMADALFSGKQQGLWKGDSEQLLTLFEK